MKTLRRLQRLTLVLGTVVALSIGLRNEPTTMENILAAVIMILVFVLGISMHESDIRGNEESKKRA